MSFLFAYRLPISKLAEYIKILKSELKIKGYCSLKESESDTVGVLAVTNVFNGDKHYN